MHFQVLNMFILSLNIIVGSDGSWEGCVKNGNSGFNVLFHFRGFKLGLLFMVDSFSIFRGELLVVNGFQVFFMNFVVLFGFDNMGFSLFRHRDHVREFFSESRLINIFSNRNIKIEHFSVFVFVNLGLNSASLS